MTPRFILDENVVIFAQLGLDEHDHPDTTCADLVQRIINICHTLVVDDVLWQKYDAQLNSLGHQRPEMGAHLMRVLLNALLTTDKITGFGHDAAPFEEEHRVPIGSQKDTYLVRLAVESGAMLVTADAPLRDGLRDSGLEADYGLTVLTPEQALSLL